MVIMVMWLVKDVNHDEARLKEKGPIITHLKVSSLAGTGIKNVFEVKLKVEKAKVKPMRLSWGWVEKQDVFLLPGCGSLKLETIWIQAAMIAFTLTQQVR